MKIEKTGQLNQSDHCENFFPENQWRSLLVGLNAMRSLTDNSNTDRGSRYRSVLYKIQDQVRNELEWLSDKNRCPYHAGAGFALEDMRKIEAVENLPTTRIEGKK